MPYASSIQPQSITVHFSNGDAFVWPAAHPNFDKVKQALRERADDSIIRDLMDKISQVKEVVSEAAASLGNTIEVTREGVLYQGEPLDISVCTRIVEHVREGFDVKPLVNFLEKLLKNHSRDAVYSLYDFLAANDIVITEDGDFLAYKRVNADYTDIYTGKFDNSVGKKLRIPPWQVEARRDQTCAKGLHVCSRSYLPHFGAYGGNRVVICKVDPADVIAVPTDYNNAKMRVCAYEVIGELNDVQMAEIFDQQRVLNTREAPYVSWHDDYAPQDEDTDEAYSTVEPEYCEHCGEEEDYCYCDPQDFEDKSSPLPPRADLTPPPIPTQEPPPIVDAPEPPKKKSWFNWGGS